MESARRGSEVEASESCVSGTTRFWRRRRASWKRFVSSCSNPLLTLPRRRGSGIEHPHPDPPPQAGEGKRTAVRGRKSTPPPYPPPQAGEGKRTAVSRRGRDGTPAPLVPHHGRTRPAGGRRQWPVTAETGNSPARRDNS